MLLYVEMKYVSEQERIYYRNKRERRTNYCFKTSLEIE